MSGLLLSSAIREQPERAQHLRGDDVVALVLAVSQRDVRLVGVQPRVLQRVGVELGVEPDAAPLLPQVQQVAAGLGDALDGLAQLRPAVAALAAEHVAGEAFAVRPDSGADPGSLAVTAAARSPRPKARCSRPSTSPSKREHAGGRGVPVGEPQRHDTWVRIVAVGSGSGIGLLAQSVLNRDESA